MIKTGSVTDSQPHKPTFSPLDEITVSQLSLRLQYYLLARLIVKAFLEVGFKTVIFLTLSNSSFLLMQCLKARVLIAHIYQAHALDILRGNNLPPLSISHNKTPKDQL